MGGAAPAALVRPVRAEDAAHVAAMWRALFEDHARCSGRPEDAPVRGALEAQLLAWAGGLADGDGSFGLIAETSADRAACGFLAATVRPRPWLAVGRVGNVGALWIAPAHRRRGLGAALARAAWAEFGRRGVTLVELHVLACDAAALGFWRSLGFGDDAVLLAARLSPAGAADGAG